MTRYFTRRQPAKAIWVEDDYYAPEAGNVPCLSVPEHEAADTGLLDQHGDSIMRAPNPMGFVWD